MNKQEIRKNCLSQRNNLSKEEITEKSQQIIHRLEGEPFFKNAQRVLFYYAHQNEVDTKPAIERWAHKKKIYLPQVGEHGQMLIFPWKDSEGLQKNKYGIFEPETKEATMSQEVLDLILIPGVAFDLKGQRIGMGKGYYDRFLAGNKQVLKVALAYEIQIFDELPKDPYDEVVDIIITENRIINVR